ncbi:MAG: DUF4386 domain-containing protein [Candidatus Lokiarchaeota archaeon]|nr:DUF4386 domain-containing protein [Candidatus Lokiarchaeota archaeon]
MIILIKLAGFLFLFILFLYLILLPALGYKAEIGDSDAELQKINDDPKKFQISIGLALIHNVIVITLTIMLFIVFGPPYNIILGIVWTIFRIGEGLILSYNDKNYGSLLNISRKYSDTSGAEKSSLSDLARTITKTKSSRFDFAMIFWSIGTLAFSIMLVTYGVVPPLIGWLGIVASIFVGFADGIKFVKPNAIDSKVFKVLFSIGGLVAILFEVLIGGWLLFFSIITP